MITMVTLAIIVIILLAFGVMVLIGLFDKHTGLKVGNILLFVKSLKLTRRNLALLPRKLRLFLKIWPRKRLLFRKIKRRLRAEKRRKRRTRRRSGETNKKTARGKTEKIPTAEENQLRT